MKTGPETLTVCSWQAVAWEVVIINGHGNITERTGIVYRDAREAWSYCDHVNAHVKSGNAAIPEPRNQQWLMSQAVAFRQVP